ncbi:hypothetical protein TMatcc_003132 [Talaromyces marneffei ATCC 18224]
MHQPHLPTRLTSHRGTSYRGTNQCTIPVLFLCAISRLIFTAPVIVATENGLLSTLGRSRANY